MLILFAPSHSIFKQNKCTRECNLFIPFLNTLSPHDHGISLQTNGAGIVHVVGCNNLGHTRLDSESGLSEDESSVTHPVSLLQVLELWGTSLEGVDGG